MMAKDSKHPMTAEEFYQQVKGFYDLLKRLTEAVEQIAEALNREPSGGGNQEPPSRTSRAWRS
jgi:hypothetical protein